MENGRDEHLTTGSHMLEDWCYFDKLRAARQRRKIVYFVKISFLLLIGATMMSESRTCGGLRVISRLDSEVAIYYALSREDQSRRYQ